MTPTPDFNPNTSTLTRFICGDGPFTPGDSSAVRITGQRAPGPPCLSHPFCPSLGRPVPCPVLHSFSLFGWFPVLHPSLCWVCKGDETGLPALFLVSVVWAYTYPPIAPICGAPPEPWPSPPRTGESGLQRQAVCQRHTAPGRTGAQTLGTKPRVSVCVRVCACVCVRVCVRVFAITCGPPPRRAEVELG